MNIDYQQMKSQLDAGGYTFENPVVSQFHEDYMKPVKEVTSIVTPRFCSFPDCTCGEHSDGSWDMLVSCDLPEKPRYRIYFSRSREWAYFYSLDSKVLADKGLTLLELPKYWPNVTCEGHCRMDLERGC